MALFNRHNAAGFIILIASALLEIYFVYQLLVSSYKHWSFSNTSTNTADCKCIFFIGAAVY